MESWIFNVDIICTSVGMHKPAIDHVSSDSQRRESRGSLITDFQADPIIKYTCKSFYRVVALSLILLNSVYLQPRSFPKLNLTECVFF